MNQNQTWLLKRLLLPLGIIPPTINLEDFNYYEKTRNKVGNIGFEYFYMCGQNFDDINKSIIKDKIYALHTPWNGFPPIEKLSEPTKSLVKFLILRNREIPKDIIERTRLSLEFAKKIGATVIVSHVSFFDHHKLKEQLQKFAELEDQYKIPIAIEHDAPYVYEHLKKGTYYLKIDGSYDWIINPATMSTALHKILPEKQFGICYDSAALIGANIPLIKSAKPIIKQIIHVHLANNNVGTKDEALEIDRPEIVDLVNYLYESNYSKLITAEIHGVVGDFEELTAKAHTALALVGIDLLRPTVLTNSQRHLQNSCNYLLNGLK